MKVFPKTIIAVGTIQYIIVVLVTNTVLYTLLLLILVVLIYTKETEHLTSSIFSRWHQQFLIC